jgi:hypothetical protein
MKILPSQMIRIQYHMLKVSIKMIKIIVQINIKIEIRMKSIQIFKVISSNKISFQFNSFHKLKMKLLAENKGNKAQKDLKITMNMEVK